MLKTETNMCTFTLHIYVCVKLNNYIPNNTQAKTDVCKMYFACQ